MINWCRFPISFALNLIYGFDNFLLILLLLLYVIILSTYHLFSLIVFNLTFSFDGASTFYHKITKTFLIFYFKNSKPCQSTTDMCIMLGDKKKKKRRPCNFGIDERLLNKGHTEMMDITIRFVFFAYFLFLRCLRRFTRDFSHFLSWYDYLNCVFLAVDLRSFSFEDRGVAWIPVTFVHRRVSLAHRWT